MTTIRRPSSTSLRTAFAALIVVLSVGMSPAAFAACSNPAGLEGEIIYNDDNNIMQFCDDTNWIGMSSGGVAGVTDGDKGDISVSNTGADWMVDDDVLNFTEFSDTLVLDASTDLSVTGSDVFSITNSGTGLSLRVNDQTTDTSPFVIDTNGNVGIGTDSPQQRLHVTGSGLQSMFVESSNTGSAQFRLKNSTTEWHFEAWNDAFNFVETSVGNRLTILEGGTVGIGNASPNASSILDLTSTTKGFLPPRMTTAQVNAIGTPADGLIAYDLDTDTIKLRANGVWVSLAAAGGAGVGDVVGPASATDNAIARYDGTTGKLIQNSAVMIDDSGATTITSADANALAVGSNGTTNPVFKVDASAASQATGIEVIGAAAGSGSILSAASSAAGETLYLRGKGTSGVALQVGATTRFAVNGSQALFTMTGPWNDATKVRFSFVGAADTGLTASTEALNVYYDLGQTRQHATGALALQRDFRITPSTHSFVAASTLTKAAGLSIDGAPSAGTNATITTSTALDIPTKVLSTGITNGYGLMVEAPSGATNNYAASFTGNTGFGTTAPLTNIHIRNGGASGKVFTSSSGLIVENNGALANWYALQVSTAGAQNALNITNSGLIGVGVAAPNASALMDLTSTTRGFLPPRMTTAQVDAIATPADGLLAYDETLDVLKLRANGAWVSLGSGGGSSGPSPSFQVRLSSNQTMSANTWTKLEFANEQFDTNNNFDNATNYRFTPTVAGKYLFTIAAQITSTGANQYVNLTIRKNGADTVYTQETNPVSSQSISPNAAVVVDMNGTTDYVEGWIASNVTTINSGNGTVFSGSLLGGGGGGGGGGSASAAGSTGAIQFNGGSSSFAADDANFFWDNTGKQLGIGTATPNSSALLDLTSTSKGLLLPRMTDVQQAAISSPADGLVVYDTVNDIIKLRANGAWTSLGSGGGTGVTDGDKGEIVVSSTGAVWNVDDDVLDFTELADNMTLDASTDITATGTNLLSITNTGTALSFRVNDQASDTSPFVIDAAGQVGVGIDTPTQPLDVVGTATMTQIIVKSTTGAAAPVGVSSTSVNNAGSSTSISFATANVAYTSAACGAFTLSDIQDGGSYTLIVKGSGTGPATFTHAGVTVKTTGTLTCTSAKHTVFSFLRAGTDVYVNAISGF